MAKTCFLLLSLLTATCTLFAQQTDSPSSRPMMDSAINSYYEGWSQKTPFSQGRQFYGYRLDIDGYAFYNTDKWVNGAVLFENTWYYDLPLLFDVHAGDLVTRNTGLSYIIVREKIRAFNIGKDKFELMGKKMGHPIPDGFYQVFDKPASPAKLELFIRRIKLLDEKPGDRGMERKFYSTDEFYILKAGKYSRVKTKKQALSLVSDKKREVMKYIKGQNVKFKRDPETFTTLLVQYYNTH